MGANDRPVVDAAVTSFEVLEAVRELDEPGVSAVARHLDRSKSGVYKHLNTLTRFGYLVRTDGGYAVGLGAWALGAGSVDRFPMEKGTRTVDSLAASTDHSVALVFYEGGHGYYAYQNCSPAIRERIGGLGDRLPLHATAAGKAILAYLPSERRTELLRSSAMTRFTGRTIVEREVLEDQLHAVRERRAAIEREERADDVAGIAAPITRGADDPVGAITVLGPTTEVDDEALEGRMVSLVVNAARSVESALAEE